MVVFLSKEKIEYIVDTYGTNIKMVYKIISVINSMDLPFCDEDDFVIVVESVVSKLETENFERKSGKLKECRACYNLRSAILSTLVDKFSDDYLYDKKVLNKILSLKQMH